MPGVLGRLGAGAVVPRLLERLEERLPEGLRLVARRVAGRGGWASFLRQGLALCVRQVRYARALRAPVRDVVLYEAFAGHGVLCNPEAIFRGLLAAADQQHLRHVWAVRDVAAQRAALGPLADHPRVRLVEYGSPGYWTALQTSRWLVNNATFPPSFVKRPEQVYLNTWHGTPLKKMGYHVVPRGGLEADNIVRNLLSADFLLSQCPHMSEQMYLSGYRLDNVFTGALVEEGYPRVDRQGGSREELVAALAGQGIELGQRDVVLYAPTWRGPSFEHPSADLDRLAATVRCLEEAFPADRYVVLLKAHQAVHEEVARDAHLSRRLVPAGLPSNVVLGGSELLVSDYSSIFFDFLATGRPVLFHVPDAATYADERGLYLRPAQLPGPVSTTLEELRTHVGRYLAEGRTGHEAALREAAATYCPWDDGSATERVIDICFRGREDGYRVRRGFSDGRQTLLVYLGQLLTNGVTTSALNLLATLDHSRYDVTATFPSTADPTKLANAARIPPQVRLLPRRDGMNRLGLHLANLRFTRAVRNGRRADWSRFEPAWRTEWRRAYGQGRFDQVIDFSGYSPFWASVLLGGGRPVVFWQHNDLAADAEREVDGVRALRDDLHATFALYPRFAALVSVSDALAEVNRRQLGHHAGRTPFLSVRNTVDGERVRRAAAEPLPAERAHLARRPGVRTFVCVGRLSPEKNHRRLLEAFAVVHAAEPTTRLVVIGDGPLRPALEQEIARRGLGAAVVLTGPLANPWQVMAQADCHVVASDYEGQPMVVLEARVLGLPVVSTRFDSAVAAVPPGAGRLVELSAEALAAGMLGQLRDPLVPEPFDVGAYNAEVLAELEDVLRLTLDTPRRRR